MSVMAEGSVSQVMDDEDEVGNSALSFLLRPGNNTSRHGGNIQMKNIVGSGKFLGNSF